MATQAQTLLALNTGSSSVKFALYDVDADTPRLRARGSLSELHAAPRLKISDAKGTTLADEQWHDLDDGHAGDAVLRLLEWLDSNDQPPVAAVGHRIVHGGDRQQVALRVDDALRRELRALTPLAPLHQPAGLALIDAIAEAHPETPQVACLDTAFHATLDPLERLYGIPRALSDRGLRRYGFHGLSYEYIASCLPQLDAALPDGRVVVAHLGSGASLCALHKGRSVATSMGFSTLDGILMATRPGRLDAGVLLYLLQQEQMSAEQLEHLLYHECGLLGVSGGIASDIRTLRQSRDPLPRQAIDLFVRSIVKEIASLTAVLGGLDGLVFTGGIGEHDAATRAAVIEGCAWLGLQLEPQANIAQQRRITHRHSPVSAWTLPTDEELVIARHCQNCLHS